LECGDVGFCRGRKSGKPGEKPFRARQKPTTNSSHIWYWPELNQATLVGGKSSHHYAICANLIL